MFHSRWLWNKKWKSFALSSVSKDYNYEKSFLVGSYSLSPSEESSGQKRFDWLIDWLMMCPQRQKNIETQVFSKQHSDEFSDTVTSNIGLLTLKSHWSAADQWKSIFSKKRQCVVLQVLHHEYEFRWSRNFIGQSLPNGNRTWWSRAKNVFVKF